MAPNLKDSAPIYAHSRKPRVVGGEESNPHSWPWQAVLYICSKKGDVCVEGCAGTLVDKQTLLTAAHCVYFGKIPASRIIVRLGAHDLSQSAYGEQNFTVANYTTGRQVLTDIAILHLKEPVTYSDTISPACLPSRDLPEDTTCYIIGWGQYKLNRNSPASLVLRQAPQRILSGKICKRRDSVYDPETQICAKWKRGVDSCYGDSGGPFLCSVNNKWELQGIVSYGSKKVCGLSPGYYTKVFAYKRQILGYL